MSDPQNLAVAGSVTQVLGPDNHAVRAAIAQASDRTGVDFGYLLAQAQVESGLDSDARAGTSSATGLFQFIDATWLETMHRHGDALGLGQYASAIEMTRHGAQVFDPATRSAILDLRRDPEIASLMAAALADDNRAALAPILGREPDASELYMAHFLGSGGASTFLSALQSDPDQSAAALFPRPAAANRAIFYSGGAPRSLAAVMDLMRGKIERAMPDPQHAQIPLVPPTMRGPAQTFAVLQARSAAAIPYERVMAFDGVTSSGQTPRPAISDLLKRGFDTSGGSELDQARNHAREAYIKLKAAGL